MTVSVVIPTYEGRALLPLALDSLRGQRRPVDEVVVVDNGSRDGTVTWLRAAHPDVVVVPLGQNTGFSAAVNAGIEVAGGEYVALLNNDVEVAPDWSSELLLALEAFPKAGSAASKMLLFHDRGVIDGCGDALAGSGLALPRGHRRADRGQFDAPSEVFGARAGAALYRRAALDDVGPFDEDYFAFSEDVDWALRARLRGWTCRYVPTAVAYHVGGASSTDSGGMSPRFYAMNRRNTIWTVLAGFPARTLLRRSPQIVAGQVALGVIAARDGMVRAQLSAWTQAVVGLGGVRRKRRRVQARAIIGPKEFERALEPGVRPR